MRACWSFELALGRWCGGIQCRGLLFPRILRCAGQDCAIDNNAREYAVPDLPYLVIYLPMADSIDVFAVFHTARDPKTKRQP
jgi:hypothetical protein